MALSFPNQSRGDSPIPAQQSIMANLVASVGMRQGWGVPFVRAAYRRWLQLGQETGSEPNLSESLRDVAVEPERALALAKTAEAKAALMEETGLARNLGIFGSPTFVVGRDFFGAMIALRTRSAGTDTVLCAPLLDFPEPDSLSG
jgi:2-hydroxychromene-2-carboxylate isomerase